MTHTTPLGFYEPSLDRGYLPGLPSCGCIAHAADRLIIEERTGSAAPLGFRSRLDLPLRAIITNLLQRPAHSSIKALRRACSRMLRTNTHKHTDGHTDTHTHTQTHTHTHPVFQDVLVNAGAPVRGIAFRFTSANWNASSSSARGFLTGLIQLRLCQNVYMNFSI